MVNYPNLKKAPANVSIPKKSTSKHYTAFRGMSLEEDINLSNTYYLSVDQAVIYKKPTPIQIVKVDYPSRNKARIVEAYYQAPSTTDYNGIYKGRYIDFEAKNIDKDKFVKGMFSYECLWHKENANPDNPEYLVTRGYMADDNNYDWTRYTYIRPSQLISGYSSYEPMQGLIDAYWDIDGKTIRPEIPVATRKENFAKITAVVEGMDQTTYIKTVPTLNLKEYAYMDEFRNRDSRLYASMLFPFKGWHETDFGTFYYRWNPSWAGSDGNESWTGYSYRKLLSLTAYSDWASMEDYPVIRYAEVLLTYAEARIQTKGWDAEVQKALNDLRDRCGMPDVPTVMPSKEAALDFVRNERRIELAAEGQRYDDIRRYGSAYCNKVMNGTVYAPNGYEVVNMTWSDRLMLMPIPQGAMDLNPLLRDDQNPGY